MESPYNVGISGDARKSSMTKARHKPASPAPARNRGRPSNRGRESRPGANISPATGLATDYLNHFNEAIMLLDLVATVPECRIELMAWRPKSYREHFAGSSLTDRDLAVAAYDAADPAARHSLERLADAMTAILIATRDAMAAAGRGKKAAAEAAGAAALLRALVAEAGAVINGQAIAPATAGVRLGR
jgi:hypothetical protein